VIGAGRAWLVRLNHIEGWRSLIECRCGGDWRARTQTGRPERAAGCARSCRMWTPQRECIFDHCSRQRAADHAGPRRRPRSAHETGFDGDRAWWRLLGSVALQRKAWSFGNGFNEVW